MCGESCQFSSRDYPGTRIDGTLKRPLHGEEMVEERIQSADDPFIRSRTVELTLRGGMRIRMRPIVPDDKPRLVEGFERLSPLSRYRRFLAAVTRLRPDQLARLTEIDYVNHFALGAIAVDEAGEPGVAVARYVRYEADPETADAAVTVLDAYQGHGLGTLLMRALGAVARENGIRRFRADVLADNRPVREMLTRLGARIEAGGNPSTYVIDLASPGMAAEGTPYQAALQALARGEAPAGTGTPGEST
jgi:GNAT superfamily N-acetyltransferase